MGWVHVGDDLRPVASVRGPTIVGGAEEFDVVGMMNFRYAGKVTQARLNDSMTVVGYRRQKNPVSLRTVGLIDIFAAAKDRGGVMKGLIGVMHDKHSGLPSEVWWLL
jgi:hypothetical protein